MGTLLFLAPPIVACIILAGILSYFGNHILSRGIIFIDIAVAQIAALGTMIGILLGFAENSVNTGGKDTRWFKLYYQNYYRQCAVGNMEKRVILFVDIHTCYICQSCYGKYYKKGFTW